MDSWGMLSGYDFMMLSEEKAMTLSERKPGKEKRFLRQTLRV